MTKLRIGYWPLSANLNSAGDRRRVLFWARERGHTVITDLSQKVDLYFVSERADFNSKYFHSTKTPIIFDLIDAYLSPANLGNDIARGIAKRFSHQVTGPIKPFSKHVEDFCIKSNAVFCSSPEQAKLIEHFNPNIHVILDSHDEIPFLPPRQFDQTSRTDLRILWEGQAATIRGIRQLMPALQLISENHSIALNFVTDEKYFKVLGKYMVRETSNLLQKDLGSLYSKSTITSWSVENLVSAALSCNASLIPINLSSPMQALKPENRLLIMWRLGLPCLTSSSASYERVLKRVGVNSNCKNVSDWYEKLEELMTDPQSGYEQVIKGQNYVRENHTAAILLSKWDHAVESVLS